MFLVSHACSSQVALLDLTLELQECLLIMSGNNSSSCSSLDALQSLGAAEPSWVVTGQPALWDTITPLWEFPMSVTAPFHGPARGANLRSQ